MFDDFMTAISLASDSLTAQLPPFRPIARADSRVHDRERPSL
jgi:hypothetical protein